MEDEAWPDPTVVWDDGDESGITGMDTMPVGEVDPFDALNSQDD